MRRGVARFRIAVLSAVLTFGIIGASSAAEPGSTYPVGIRQVEFTDAHYGPRTLSMAVFYPAVIDDSSAKPFVMPFFTRLTLYKDAEIAFDSDKLPLVMLSHGRGSTGLSYAWFAQTLAAHGYIVAAPYHWRANSYDSTVAYLANKLWQRPVDVSLDIDFLLRIPRGANTSTRAVSGSPATAKAASPRSGSAAPRSTGTSISPSSRAGRTTSRSPRTCETRCRSTPSRRSR